MLGAKSVMLKKEKKKKRESGKKKKIEGREPVRRGESKNTSPQISSNLINKLIQLHL